MEKAIPAAATAKADTAIPAAVIIVVIDRGHGLTEHIAGGTAI